MNRILNRARWIAAVVAGLILAAAFPNVGVAGLAWVASPQLQRTVTTVTRDYQLYKETHAPTSIGLRLEFWQKSLRFIAEAPVIGHGTGSTRGLFEQAATGPAVLAGGQVASNPHNQTLHVAIQWGVLGVILLYAIWWRHLLLFRSAGLAAWIGLLVVVQNIFTSLFNSHLFDFSPGWMYVLGVGVAGGMVLGARFTSPQRGEVDLLSKSGEGALLEREPVTPHPALRADLSQRER